MNLLELLSPEARQRIEAEAAEVARLFGLQNAWLASALLQLARQAQAALPARTPGECTYDARLIWGIVPEIARRLGVIRMTTNEIDWEIRELTDYELRVRAGYTLANVGWANLPGWTLLTREIGNGNPVVFAVDRLCPGRPGDQEDPLVMRLASLAHVRGTQYAGVWTPALLRPPQPSEPTEEAETPVFN